MNYLKKIFVYVFICGILAFPQNAQAITSSAIMDKTINCTAKATYFITKYTLKTAWFIVKKTTKGTIAVSKGIFNGTKDAFSSSSSKSQSRPAPKKQEEELYTLPPVPSID